jgi:hypothetical protein
VYVEQKIRTCERCHQPFVLQYEYVAERVPSYDRDLITLRFIRCPDLLCGHLNPLVMLLRVHNVLVKEMPAPLLAYRLHGS